MNNKRKLFSRKSPPEHSAHMIRSVFKCKWSLTVYQLLSEDIKRPGEMVRSIEGLSTKVLNDCLKKNIEFGIINRIEYNEVPPRVEYNITPFGKKFLSIIDQLKELQNEMSV